MATIKTVIKTWIVIRMNGELPGGRSNIETRFGKGKYTEPFGHPLADDRDLESYSAPDPDRPELYAEAERVIREL